MGLSAQTIREGLDAIARAEPAIARALERTGYPEPRIRARGATTLLRTIVGQQVSVAAASSVWIRLEVMFGPGVSPSALLAASEGELRSCGLSRQKQGYARSLCELVTAGTLDLENLPEGDEAAGALMSFTLSIDDFVITFFTAGVGVSTLPLQIFTMIKVAVTPEVNAVSTLLMLVTLTLIVLASRVAPRQP